MASGMSEANTSQFSFGQAGRPYDVGEKEPDSDSDDPEDSDYEDDAVEEDEDEDEGYDGGVSGHAIGENEEERHKREQVEQLVQAKERSLADIDREISKASKNETHLIQAEFLHKYGDDLDYIMEDSSPTKKNVLHMLALHRFEDPGQFPRWIIDHIHRNALIDGEGTGCNSISKLLADKAHMTPSLAIGTAIRWKNEPFIRTILSLELHDSSQSLRNSLREMVGSYETLHNCIHYAIGNLNQDLAVQIIEKAAGDKCLLARDVNGYTPLHLAVEYPKCLDRLEVIRALLKYGENALDERCNDKLSVYRYYQKTKTDYNAKVQKKRSSKAAALPAPERTPEKSRRSSKKTNERQKAGNVKREHEREKGDHNDTTKPLNDDKDRGRDQDKDRSRDGVVAREALQPTAEGGGLLGSGSPRLARQKTGIASQETPKTSKAAEVRKKNNTTKKITTRPKNAASLTEGSKEREEDIEDEIKLQYLRSTFKHPKPDRDVKYVKGFLYPKGKVRRIIINQTKNKDVGRTDMEIIFKLLKDRGVRHIVKVIVFDSESPPHSDESIERCLSGFKSVEILDWRKIDLCPETIYKSCPDVVELHLWWGGNNATLIAWSAPGGLAKLRRLKEIYIHQTQCIESADRDKENLKHFKERLFKDRIEERPKKYILEEQQKLALSGERLPITVLDMWPVITVDDSDTSSGALQNRSLITHNLQLNQAAARYRRRHEWLDIMDKFAAGIDLIDIEGSDLPSAFADDVRIALIDDGVEITNRNLTNRVYNGWTCDAGYEGNGLEGIPRPYTNSETQHGTFMASTICRICPRAKIFVFRLDVVSEPGARAHFTAKSAAEALELAIEPSRKFDIISMSWTIVKDTTNESDLVRLEAALKKASVTNKVLLFCASPDSGEMTKAKAKTFYPFGCSIDVGLFKMAAATVDGIRIPTAGSHFDYSLPGHEVEESSQLSGDGVRELLRSRQTAEDEHDGLKTGSSIATALGAGLAALIIHCVRLGAAYIHKTSTSPGNADGNTNPRPLTDDSENSNKVNNLRDMLGLQALEHIKQPAQMRVVFDCMVSGGSSSDRYIEVWAMFKECGDKIEALGKKIDELKVEIENTIQLGSKVDIEKERVLRQMHHERMKNIVGLALKLVNAS